MKVEFIIEVLPSLSQKDIQKVRDVTGFLLDSDDKTSSVVTTSEEDEIFNALGKAISDNNIEARFNYNGFKNSKNFALCRRNVKGLPEFVLKHFGKISKVDRLAVYVLMHNILINDLRERNIPLSIGSISRNMKRITETFNNEFPGYLKSGLGKMVLNAMKRGEFNGQ